MKDCMKSDCFTFAVLLVLSSVNRGMRGMGILTLGNKTFFGAEMQMRCKHLGQQRTYSLGKSLLKV